MCLCLYKHTRPVAFNHFTLQDKETKRFKKYIERSVNKIRTLNVSQFEIFIFYVKELKSFDSLKNTGQNYIFALFIF